MTGFIQISMIIVTTLILLRVFRKQIRQWAYKIRAKLQIRSLRVAIKQADDDKSETQRKNMVVFNTLTGQFEPLQKKVLKGMSRATKNKNNAAMTDGRKRALLKQKKKQRYFTHEKVKETEKKSLYVTD
jgi:type II secretory pathway pseudopilin PulG